MLEQINVQEHPMFETVFKLNRLEAGHRKKIFILTLLTFIALC